MNPTLSIIIPVFNAAETLQACLDSIVMQGYRDYEVLVIDGHSSDTSVAIANKYLDQLPGMRIISEIDKGIYDAMNKGIQKAQGEWLYFIGSDDVLYNSRTLSLLFERQKSLMEISDIVYGNVVFKEFNIHSEYHSNFDLMDFMDTNINHQSMFYRKSVFDTIGMYDLEYPVFADWELNIRCFFSGKFRITHVKDIIACFSLSGTSNTTSDAWIGKKDHVILSLIRSKPFYYKLVYSNKRNKKSSSIEKITFRINTVLIRLLQLFNTAAES